MWIGRRSLTKPTAPGKLDQLVAGGQPAGVGVRANLVKEAAEEADIGPELAARAVPVGTVNYLTARPDGLRNDVLFNYDLVVPPDFRPVNRDGEIASFHLWSLDEVAAIRDKIAASKAKGMWMGGTVPLGYDPPANSTRALAVNQEEAEIVRTIFGAYVDLGSVHALQRWLGDRGIRSKRRVTRAGRLSGGRPFSRGALFHLLRNRIYLGMIVHKGRAHPGRHHAIVDTDLFEAVQARLDANTRRRASNREQKSNAPLAGRLFDVDGRPMSPTFSYGRGGKLYRYYVSAPLQQGARRDQSDTAIRRIAAPPLEVALATVLRRVIPGCPDAPITLVVRAEIHDQSLHCLLPIDRIVAMRERLEPHERVEPDPVDARLARLHLPLVRRRGQTWVLKGPSAGNRPDPVLVKALRSAHAMLHQDDAGLPVLDAGPDTPYRRRLVRLAFLAPEIQRAIVEGRQSAGVTLTQLLKGPIPLVWSQQAVQIGIATSPE